MLLINAGTNKHVPSARITAIDPCGGAAVLGDNGVGKTTTLRILPLFFGHLPSQIVAASDGQEAMIRLSSQRMPAPLPSSTSGAPTPRPTCGWPSSAGVRRIPTTRSTGSINRATARSCSLRTVGS